MPNAPPVPGSPRPRRPASGCAGTRRRAGSHRQAGDRGPRSMTAGSMRAALGHWAVIGGRQPLQGRKAGRSAGPRRASAPAVLPLCRARAGSSPARPRRAPRTAGGPRAGPRVPGRLRPAARRTRRRSRSGCEEEGPRNLQLRRDQLVGVCHRGDPAGPVSPARARSSLSVEVAVAIALLLAVVRCPTARSAGVPERWRRVCRGEVGANAALWTGRCGGPPDRLRDDGRGLDVRRARPDPSVLPAAYKVRIEIAVLSIALITIANLRGLRESGNIFAIPTYCSWAGARDRCDRGRSGS